MRNDDVVDTLIARVLRQPWVLLKNRSWDLVPFQERTLATIRFEPDHFRSMARGQVLSDIQARRASVRAVELVRSSPEHFVPMVGDVFGCFDFCAGSKNGVNLKSQRIRDYITSMDDRFCYIGDSRADELIFQAAEKYYRV
jgi:hypothetical protein